MTTRLIYGALLVTLLGCESDKKTDVPLGPEPTTTATTVTTAEPAPPPSDTAAPAPAASEAASDPTSAPAGSDRATAPTPSTSASVALTELTPSATASAATEEAGKHMGDKTVEGSYAAWLQSGGRYVAGQPGALQAVLVAKGDYHCNDKYPYKFKLNAPPEGVTFASDTVKGAAVGKERTVLSVPFTPTTAGQKTITGTFHFSVCNEETCKIEKKSLSMTINVNDA